MDDLWGHPTRLSWTGLKVSQRLNLLSRTVATRFIWQPCSTLIVYPPIDYTDVPLISRE